MNIPNGVFWLLGAAAAGGIVYYLLKSRERHAVLLPAGTAVPKSAGTAVPKSELACVAANGRWLRRPGGTYACDMQPQTEAVCKAAGGKWQAAVIHYCPPNAEWSCQADWPALCVMPSGWDKIRQEVAV